jgi:hypothetical protein
MLDSAMKTYMMENGLKDNKAVPTPATLNWLLKIITIFDCNRYNVHIKLLCLHLYKTIQLN